MKVCSRGHMHDGAKHNCPECNRARVHAWVKAHPERARAWQRINSRARNARRRARKGLACFEPFTPAQWSLVLDFYGHACAYCGGPYEHDDHVIPISRGGADALYNLVPACAWCNESKKDRLWRVPVEHPAMYLEAA